MERWQHIRHTWFDEPTIWLLRSFFQPTGFKHDFETRGLSRRLWAMLHLLFPMLVFSFPLALLIRVSLLVLKPELYARYNIHSNAHLLSVLPLFVWDALWVSVASCIVVGL